MNPVMSLILSVVAILVLLLLVLLGVSYADMRYFFGVVVPYAAIATFIIGFIVRLLQWARTPGPFWITITCGQAKSSPWIEANDRECPSSIPGVIKRMALEIFLFRSLFRNSSAELKNGTRLIDRSTKWLWLAGLAFHWSLLVIIIRHLQFLTEPVPYLISLVKKLDGILEISVPTLYMTDVVILAALVYLLVRRILIPKIRYLSLAADYFPLFLILSIVISGLLMRHMYKVDLFKVKEVALGLVMFQPTVPVGLGLPFFIHLILVCALLAYLPFSKIMHLEGTFLSPTYNLDGSQGRSTQGRGGTETCIIKAR